MSKLSREIKALDAAAARLGSPLDDPTGYALSRQLRGEEEAAVARIEAVRSGRKFYALTTTNPSGGWYIVAIEDTKAKAYETAENELIFSRGDIYGQTKRTNLRVVSKTKARKEFGITEQDVESFYGDGDDEGSFA